jgi:V8-like Glu-specific endopeptidase
MQTSLLKHAALQAAIAATLLCACNAPVSAQSLPRSLQEPIAGSHALSQQPCDEGNDVKPAFASATAVPSPTQDDPLCVLAYWTDEKMKEAETTTAVLVPPDEGPLVPWADELGYFPVTEDHEDYASDQFARLNGMLFFAEPDGKPTHCSASIIQSHTKSIILTAAHCVTFKSDWKKNIMFVPAYNGLKSGLQKTPLGRWPIKVEFIPYENADNTDDDIAVARIYPLHDVGYDTAPIEGPLIGDLVGSGFVPRRNAAPETFELLALYGYPGVHDHSGKQFECVTHSAVSSIPEFPTVLYTPNCSALSGNSGGPFISGMTPAEVVSVVHFTSTSSRLTKENFDPIFEAADRDVDTSSRTRSK